jgi:hypothetical protein
MSQCCVILTMPVLFITLSIPRKMFIKKVSWYWPQELLSMPIDNIHKSWVTTVWHNTGQLCQQIRLPRVLARDRWAMQLSL